MTTAEIKFDDLNKLYVAIEYEDITNYLFHEDEIANFFKVVDKIKYKSIRIHKNALKLIADEEEVVIRDINRFCKENCFKKIPAVEKQAKRVISQYNRQHAKDKKKENIKLGKKKIIVTGIVMGMLFLASAATHVNDYEDSVRNEQSVDDLKDEFDASISMVHIGDKINYSIDGLKEKGKDVVAEQKMTELADDSIENQDGYCVYLDYTLSSDIKKRNHAYDNFYSIVEECATKWGISSNIIMAMLTQESGGYKTNLMQIEFDAWKGQKMKVYNFQDNRYDYFVLTNEPEKYAGQNITCITEKDLENPVTNISMACVILRVSAEYDDYHVLAAIQCYNFGMDNMDTVLNKTVEETGQTREEMLSDQENITFYQYTYCVDAGDPKYLSHVFAFLSDYGEVITFKHFKNHEIVEEVITIFSKQQVNTYH